jgi:hypothetical protein
LSAGAADSALADRVRAAGYPGELSGYDGDIVSATPDEVVAGFLADSAQCEALWNPAATVREAAATTSTGTASLELNRDPPRRPRSAPARPPDHPPCRRTGRVGRQCLA